MAHRHTHTSGPPRHTLLSPQTLRARARVNGKGGSATVARRGAWRDELRLITGWLLQAIPQPWQ
eukprot:7387995-Prymnesium_polylepis.1